MRTLTLLLLAGTAFAKYELPRGPRLEPQPKHKTIILEQGGPSKKV